VRAVEAVAREQVVLDQDPSSSVRPDPPVRACATPSCRRAVWWS